jgi:hypothetical protein
VRTDFSLAELSAEKTGDYPLYHPVRTDPKVTFRPTHKGARTAALVELLTHTDLRID